MKECIRDRTISFLLIIAVAVTFIVTLFSAITCDTNNIKINDDDIMEFNKGWTYIDQGRKNHIDTLPIKNKDINKKDITISNILPSDSVRNNVMCIESTCEELSIYVENNLIYKFQVGSKGPFGKTLGCTWNIVKIPRNLRGKEISIETKFTPNQPTGGIYNITLGNKSATILYLLRNNLGTIIFCFITMVLGITFMIIAVILRIRDGKNKTSSFTNIGLYMIICAIWAITDTNLLQFLSGNIRWRYVLSYLSFMLLPIPLLRYIKDNVTHGKKYFDLLSLSFILVFAINVFLYLFKIADLWQTIFLVHILIFISVVLIITACFKEKHKYNNKDAMSITGGIIILVISGLFSVLQFNMGNYNSYSKIFRYGMLAFITILVIHMIKRYIAMRNLETEHKIYKKLAYVDIPTKFYNRTAFEEDIDHIENKNIKVNSVTMIVFDLNNLKQCNDTYGHYMGDEIIKGLAYCIGKTFSSLGKCYRIGGDEFVVILTDFKEEHIEDAIDKLHRVVKEYNEEHEHKISVAFGYYREELTNEKIIDMRRIFQKADKNMYDNKNKEDFSN